MRRHTVKPKRCPIMTKSIDGEVYCNNECKWFDPEKIVNGELMDKYHGQCKFITGILRLADNIQSLENTLIDIR